MISAAVLSDGHAILNDLRCRMLMRIALGCGLVLSIGSLPLAGQSPAPSCSAGGPARSGAIGSVKVETDMLVASEPGCSDLWWRHQERKLF